MKVKKRRIEMTKEEATEMELGMMNLRISQLELEMAHMRKSRRLALQVLKRANESRAAKK